MPPLHGPILNRILALFLLLLAAAAAGVRAEEGGGPLPPYRPRNGLGHEDGPGSADGSPRLAVGPVPDAAGEGGEAEDGPLWVRLVFPWSEVEPEPGRYDWSALDRRVSAYRQAGGYRIILAPLPDRRAVPESGKEALRADWYRLARLLARRYAAAVDWFEARSPLGRQVGLRDLSYDVKSLSVTVRAEDLSVGIALPLPVSTAPELLLELFEEDDLVPYVDGVALESEAGLASDARAEDAYMALMGVHPAASFWLTGLPPGEPGAEGEAALFRRYLEGLGHRADLVLFRLPPEGGADGLPSPPRGGDLLRRLRTFFVPGLGRGGGGADELGFFNAGGEPERVRSFRFFDPETFRVLVAYFDPEEPREPREVLVRLNGLLARKPRLEEPLEGRWDYRRFRAVEGEKEGTVQVDLPLSSGPRILSYQEGVATPGIELSPEEVEVSGTRGLSAAEIIARHQRFEAWQRDRLLHYRGDGGITLHIRFGNLSGTFDITAAGQFFWDRRTGAEWAIDDIYFNGVRSVWKKFPELPFISREQVAAVPLDLDLDRRYRYERLEDQVIDGRECYQLRFRPLDDSEPLYRGRVSIDKATYAKVRVAAVATQVSPPTISVEDRTVYRPVEGPEGLTYWVLARIDGQEIRTISGRNLVIVREVDFREVNVNDLGFHEERREAYASDRQMLRDTPTGMKWLERTEEGSRQVRSKPDNQQLFALGGVLYDEGLDGAVPLLGVNYTHMDVGGKAKLLNVFFAGVFANVTLTDPSLFGTKVDLGANLSGFALYGNDLYYDRGVEDVEQRLRERSQSLWFDFGYPLGQYVKLRGSYELDWIDYKEADETAEDYVVPSDHLDQTGLLELGLDWRGWGFRAQSSWSRRSRWEEWGPASDPVTGEELAAARSYSRWFLLFNKTFYLPHFMKFELEAQRQGGSDLDRFSAWRFGFLGGQRVRGFGGSGIRYDRGWVLEGEYSFSLAEAIRFGLTVDHAIVHDDNLSPEATSHTGVGVAANFLAPWNLAFRLDAGYALKSDLPTVEGNWELLFVVLRLF